MPASVGVLRLAPLALLLCGCFADPGRYGASEGSSTDTGAATAELSATASPTTGDALTTAPPGHATTSPDTSDEPPGSTTTTTDPPDPTSTASPTSTTSTTTTGPPPAQCGNGELDPGEACDDGDFNGGATCNLDCSVPTCLDFLLNQGESDIDCGGPCQPCAACRGCNDDTDCAAPTPCAGGVCAGATPITIDYLSNCAENVSDWPVGPTFPAGEYRITAIGGGGAVKVGPDYYGWLVQCDDLDLTEMSAPFVHASPQDAFQALPTKQVVRAYPGGPLRCGLQDIACEDNSGAVSLSFAPQCP
jgi:cysteine-rich repeat protein